MNQHFTHTNFPISASFAENHTFSAKERDSETGLSYFGARYYSSDLSIWLSVDPMSDKYPSLSPYVYCADNPIKLVDPNGEDVWKPDGKGGWIAQAGDNAWTLHRDAGISFEKAIELMKAQGFVFTDNDQKVKVQVGDRVQVSEPSYNKYDIPYRHLHLVELTILHSMLKILSCFLFPSNGRWVICYFDIKQRSFGDQAHTNLRQSG
ncbi:MAG: RHS repeat-associated core domain-containing protein [Bacteroidales bacterium]|nr:RHS repeat-associated core domain-containing protein [Bacteroidales bacterium]